MKCILLKFNTLYCSFGSKRKIKPNIMAREIKVKTLRLKPEAVDKVNKLADENNRTFSNMVETILLKFNPDDYRSMI